MSAYVVDTEHVNFLVNAALDLGGDGGRFTFYVPDETAEYGMRRVDVNDCNAEHMGAVLLAENVASVNHRYREEEWEPVFTFRRILAGTPDPVIVLKAVACFAYQACEHDGWATSDAKAFCDALEQTAIRRLPGYGDAPWEISDSRAAYRMRVQS